MRRGFTPPPVHYRLFLIDLMAAEKAAAE